MSETNERDITVDLLRGLAAVCVILGHSFIIHPVNIMAVSWCKIVHDFIFTFHMGLFFILAGWVWHCSNYKKYVIKKTMHIVIPYLIFGTGSLVLHLIAGDLVNSNVSLKDGIVKLLLYGGDYWFLYTIFIVYVGYPVLDKIFNNILKKIIFLVALLLFQSFCSLPQIFTLGAIVEYLPYFILGNILGESLTESKKAFVGKYWWQIALLGLSVYISLNYIIIVFALEAYAVLIFARSIAICVFLYAVVNQCAAVFEKSGGGAIQNFLTDCSRYSLQLYLFNGYILVVLRTFLCSILHITNPLIIVSIILVGNIVITLFICKIILPKVKFLSKICGV